MRYRFSRVETMADLVAVLDVIEGAPEGELLFTIKGFREWCRHYNISDSTVWKRVNQKGMTIEEALQTPVAAKGKSRCQMVTIDGETHDIQTWCEKKCIGYSSVRRRVKKGMTIEEALTATKVSGGVARWASTRNNQA